MNIIVITKNHNPISYATTLEEAQNKVIEHLGYKGLTWEHVCNLTNCDTVYSFVEVIENL